MEETKIKWYRRRLIVNRQIQLVFAFYVLAMGSVFFILGGVFIILQQRATQLNISPFEALGAIGRPLAIGVLVTLCAGTYLGFVFTNHIAGPIFRLIREMQKLSTNGTSERVVFRKNDYFQDLADAYNKVVDRVEKKN
jgi:hypothetical protein